MHYHSERAFHLTMHQKPFVHWAPPRPTGGLIAWEEKGPSFITALPLSLIVYKSTSIFPIQLCATAGISVTNKKACAVVYLISLTYCISWSSWSMDCTAFCNSIKQHLSAAQIVHAAINFSSQVERSRSDALTFVRLMQLLRHLANFVGTLLVQIMEKFSSQDQRSKGQMS